MGAYRVSKGTRVNMSLRFYPGVGLTVFVHYLRTGAEVPCGIGGVAG